MQQPATRPDPDLYLCMIRRVHSITIETSIMEAFLLVRHARSKLELGQPAFFVVSIASRLELNLTYCFE